MMTLNESQSSLLAILFAAGEPIDAVRLAEATELSPFEVHAAAQEIAEQLRQVNSPVELRRLDDSYQLCTRPEYGAVIRRALEMRRNAPLSNAALEVLAVIAYNQPTTRGFIEQVRGVDSSSVVASLVDKGLVEEAGRLDLPGRPISYRTTPSFLRCFGMQSLRELPDIAEQEQAEDTEGQLSFGDGADR